MFEIRSYIYEYICLTSEFLFCHDKKNDYDLKYIPRNVYFLSQENIIFLLKISWNNNLFFILIKNSRTHKNNIIVGDTNLITLIENDITNEFISNFIESGYIPYIKTITRPSVENVFEGRCIDHIFAKLDTEAKAFKIEGSITDHYPILLSITNLQNDLKNEYRYNINYNKLKKLCGFINWNIIYDMNDVNEATNFLQGNRPRCTSPTSPKLWYVVVLPKTFNTYIFKCAHNPI